MQASMTFGHTVSVAATTIVLATMLAGPAHGGTANNAANQERICATVIAETEPQWRIPDKLLYAISVVETGRWDAKTEQNFAWPWTVTAEGKGRYFASKATAIRAVEQLQTRGVSNIDVGCMQINLRYHPGAFADLNEAFDPVANVSYAAAFLTDLRVERKSWTQAVKHYHSSTRELQAPYRTKVFAAWREIRRESNRTRAQARKLQLAERKYERKKAALLAKLARNSSKASLPVTSAKKPTIALIDLATWPPRNVKEQRRAEIRVGPAPSVHPACSRL